MPRSSPSSAAERPGGALVLLAAASLAAAGLGNLAPPERGLGVPLLVLGALAAACAVRRHPGGRAWWAACGFLLGSAACALAPRCPAGTRQGLPVRFVVRVRDAWMASPTGWRTRVKAIALEGATGSIRHPAELAFSLGGGAALADLPPPGSLVSGAGELAGRPGLPLARPVLRAKSVLLLRELPGRLNVDRLREAGVRELEGAAGVDPGRIHAAGLAAALCLGRVEGLLGGEMDSLRRSGLVHIIAVSGMNVGMVAAMAWAVMALLRVPPWWRRWALVPVVIAFAAMAGGDAPVRRAAWAAVAYLLARQLGRPLEPVPTVWAVVALLVLVEPAALLSASFQLSAGITLALVRWVEPLAQALRRLPRRLAQEGAVVLVAQAASMPLVGAWFGAVSPLGLLANVIASPLSFVLMAVSLAALLAAPLSPAAGGLALGVLSLMQRAMDAVAGAAAVAVWSFPPLPAVLIAAFAALAVLALTFGRSAAPAAAASVALTLVWIVWPPANLAGSEVRMLPVRQGMALLVRSRGAAVLVDAGQAPGDAARELARVRVHRLDAIVLTHPDDDHIGGAALVLQRLHVGALFFAAPVAERPEIVALRRLARRCGATDRALLPGDRLTIGPMSWSILWPPPHLEGSSNDASLVLASEFGGVRVLVTGDLETPGEASLLAAGGRLGADVLQLAHHGSRTSSTHAFLDAVRPVVGLAPTGTEPRYAYPHPEVARRVRALPAVLVGQDVGAVAWADGGTVQVACSSPVSVHRRSAHPHD